MDQDHAIDVEAHWENRGLKVTLYNPADEGIEIKTEPKDPVYDALDMATLEEKNTGGHSDTSRTSTPPTSLSLEQLGQAWGPANGCLTSPVAESAWSGSSGDTAEPNASDRCQDTPHSDGDCMIVAARPATTKLSHLRDINIKQESIDDNGMIVGECPATQPIYTNNGINEFNYYNSSLFGEKDDLQEPTSPKPETQGLSDNEDSLFVTQRSELEERGDDVKAAEDKEDEECVSQNIAPIHDVVDDEPIHFEDFDDDWDVDDEAIMNGGVNIEEESGGSHGAAIGATQSYSANSKVRCQGVRKVVGGFEENDDNDSEYDPGSEFDPNDDHSDNDARPPKNRRRAKRKEKPKSPVAYELPDDIEELVELKDQLVAEEMAGELSIAKKARLSEIMAEIDEKRADLGDEPDAPAPSGSATAGNVKKDRQRPARTAREYMERINKKEEERLKRQKAKRGITDPHDDDVNDLPGKRLKSNAGISVTTTYYRPRNAQEETRFIVEQYRAVNSIEDCLIAGTLPALGTSPATRNKSEYIKFVVDSVPEGFDTRRRATESKDIFEASRLFGFRKCRYDGHNGWIVSGMRTSIRSYQLTASAWMIKRELGLAPPYGGILADVPGMGKTLETLTAIAGNRPSQQHIDDRREATLVVLPNATVLNQWKEEIEKHCSEEFSNNTVIYRSGQELKAGILSRSQIVLTTYYDVRKTYPSVEEIGKLMEEHGTEERFAEELNILIGELFKVDWYRIVLDEVHIIKNHMSQTALACFNLKGEYKWALSGTPISNRTTELFPYLKFIGYPTITNMRNFNISYRESSTAEENLHALLSVVCYRRTMKDSFLGKRMIEIPTAHAQDQWITLSKEERLIYEVVDRYYENVIIAAKKDRKTTAEKLSRLRHLRMMRLRQTISHIYTLEKVLRYNLKLRHIQYLRKYLATMGKETVYEQIGTWVERLTAIPRHKQKEATESAARKKTAEGLGLQGPENNDKGAIISPPKIPNLRRLNPFGTSTFGGTFDMDKLLEMIENDKLVEELTCTYCKKSPPVKPLQYRCHHIFCGVCVGDFLKKLPTPEEFVCPICNTQVTDIRELPTMSSFEDENIEQPSAGDANGVHIDTVPKASTFFSASDVDDDMMHMFLPSSKVTAAKEVVLRWRKMERGTKMILFTQFIKTGKALGKMLQMEGIPFLYFFGSLTLKQKLKALKDFKEDKKIEVLVMSMKCGGQSLNLTCANRVLQLDPWWNTAVEKQAFARAHRFGQLKESHYVRIFCRDTVDERIAQLQDEKDKEIDRALLDDGHTPSLMNETQLEQLFGSDDFSENIGEITAQMLSEAKIEGRGI